LNDRDTPIRRGNDLKFGRRQIAVFGGDGSSAERNNGG